MAELAETFVGGVAPHLQKTGQGLKCLIYTATKAAQNDYVVLGDFTTVVGAVANFTTGNGTPESVTVSATTANAVELRGSATTSGVVRVVVWGY